MKPSSKAARVFEVLAFFSESPETVGWAIGLIGNGLAYIACVDQTLARQT